MCGELGIPLKNRVLRKTDEFRQFKAKIFFRTILMVTIAVSCIYLLYSLLLKGRFADWIVAVNQKIFRLDYDAARTLYQWTFRNHIELVFVVGTVLVFFITFRIYLNWFVKYFMEINHGIDEIGRESIGEVSLPSELSATEKKINTIKHTLEKQKLDMKLAEQRKNDMVMYLAHDLKTPLASVIGYLNLLRDEGQISDELRQKYLSVSLDKAERLEDLINEFFEIAKFNLSNITLQYSRISLVRLLEMLLYEFQPMLHEKNLNCSLMVPEDIMIRCDADKIQRVFDNILKNAVTYSFEGTDIDIAVVGEGEVVEITFTNHGDTIPEEKLERIFEQFYRLDVSRSTSSGGAGLGLAIAKQIIELHNGTIMAKSENEMVEFKVTLPVS
ncbi:MAG: HAMP domain-containing histidine kinase [Lachnospiraceae bacterium]|nr:HAMP domain-containing histidine kinase [Lachnospiraceae bacterium]